MKSTCPKCGREHEHDGNVPATLFGFPVKVVCRECAGPPKTITFANFCSVCHGPTMNPFACDGCKTIVESN